MEAYGLIDLSTIVESGFVESGYTGSSITNFEIDQQQNIIFSIYFPNQIPFRENHSKLIIFYFEFFQLSMMQYSVSSRFYLIF